MQDKEGKLSYLQKIVDYVSTTLSKPVAAKPAKVHEISDHHQQISSKFPSSCIVGPRCWNAADCGWSGARSNQPIPADACNGCYWTTAGKQNKADIRRTSWQQHITCLACRPQPAAHLLCYKEQLSLQAVLRQ